MTTTQIEVATATQVHVPADTLAGGSIPLTLLENASLNNDSDDDGQLSSVRASRLQKAVVGIQLFAITLASSIINGLVVVGLPTITRDLKLDSSLAFWPASVSGLATASTLLLAGAVADATGPRWVELVGAFASGAFMIGQGASRNGQELVVLRALQGVGLSLHLASSVSIITRTLPQGPSRNMAFSCLGMSQPLGFSVGLVAGGALVDTVGWRTGFYMSGAITLFFAIVGLWAIPGDREAPRARDVLHDVRTTVDWVGAGLASVFMALLCYLLAVLSADVERIKDTESIVFLCIIAVAFPTFIAWVHRQVKLGKPALIPNSLWKNWTFSSVCGTIAMSFAVINSMELFASLFFQEVQHLSALQASLRILPSLIVGALTNLGMGFFVHKLPAIWIVTVTSILCAVSPLLMAVYQPSWTYWGNAFVAQLLQPISADALYTVGLIVITDVFPEKDQALAGAVFNTASQFGSALGMAVLQVISTSITKEQSGKGKTQATLEGYRASFWAMFAFMIACAVIGAAGLGKAGRIGLKRD